MHHAVMMRWQPDVVIAYTIRCTICQVHSRARIAHPQTPFIHRGSRETASLSRTTIEEFFQAPVFETYGSREFMLIGAECSEHRGLHLSMDNLLIEVVDEAGSQLRWRDLGMS